MTAAPIERWPVMATHGRGSPLAERQATDLQVVTVDPMGRLWVRQTAKLVGWAPGQALTMTVRDGVVHMSGDAVGKAGIAAALDHRRRLQLPYGLRALAGFHPGTRVLVVTIPSEGSAAVLPVHRVVAAFAVSR